MLNMEFYLQIEDHALTNPTYKAWDYLQYIIRPQMSRNNYFECCQNSFWN